MTTEDCCTVTQVETQMLRRLGNSDLQLTPLGLGTWAFGGGGWEFSLGPQDDSDSIAAIHCALDHGFNWFDTAPVYGLGRSGEILARALKSASIKPYIFTKCGICWREDGSTYNCLKASSLIGEVERSLRRLNVDCIDLSQVHWPLPESDIEEGLGALSRLRDQGKIRWIGISNFTTQQMQRAMQIAPITSIQPPYSLLRRDAESKILPFAQIHGLGAINYSPMACGLLSGGMTAESIAALSAEDSRRKNVQFQEPRLSANLKLVELLREIGNAHGVSPGVVAVAWTLHHPAITGAIIGSRTAKQVEEIAPALEFRLSEDEYLTLDKFVTSAKWMLNRIYSRLVPDSWRHIKHSF